MAFYLRYKGLPPAGPTNIAAPVIRYSVPAETMFFTVDYGSYTSVLDDTWPKLVTTHQWNLDGIPISGEINPVFQARSGDAGKTLTVTEIAIDKNGTTRTTSSGVLLAADTRSIVDLTTLGLKSSQTTGSISGGSLSTLTVASATGFSVNDPIIIEIGGESGAGARGTVGVGGTWPALSYANAAAMNADTSKPTNTIAYLADTGDIYKWSGTAWAANEVGRYYWSKVLPIAHETTISAIVGTTITLATPAAVATTSANVYFNNKAKLGLLMNNYPGIGGTPFGNDKVGTLPAGTFAIGTGQIVVNTTLRTHIKGAGMSSTTIKSPRGCSTVSFAIGQNCIDFTMTDMHMLGNVTDAGSPPPSNGYLTPEGINLATCTRGFFKNMKSTNNWQKAFCPNRVDDVWAIDCEVYSEGVQFYVQWFYLWADLNRGGTVDCKFTSTRLTKAMEAFRGNGVRHIRPVLVNGAMSMNTTGGCLFDSPHITIEALSQVNTQSFNPIGDPVININSNIGNSSGGLGDALLSLGWEVRNPTIILEGPINTAGDGVYGCISGPGNVNGAIVGGSYDCPDYPAAGSRIAYISDVTGTSVIIKDFVVKAALNPTVWDRNHGINFTQTGAGKVIDCVSDTIRAGVTSGNRSRAAYVAAGGDLDRTSPPAP